MEAQAATIEEYIPYSLKPKEEYFADQYAEQLYKHFKLEE